MQLSFLNDDAFTGLEAAIVLIAFVVVAAVFSYVVLGAGFYTSQKSQETVYKSIEQTTGNMQLIGKVYAINTTGLGTVSDKIKIALVLTPGASPVDLTKLTLTYSTQTAGPVVYTLTTGNADSTHFSATRIGTPVTTMEQQDQIDIEFLLAAALLPNEELTIEIKPPNGAALPFSRTTPPFMNTVNSL
jgi:flagellin FlaB